jgi:hypothetical protein
VTGSIGTGSGGDKIKCGQAHVATRLGWDRIKGARTDLCESGQGFVGMSSGRDKTGRGQIR